MNAASMLDAWTMRIGRSIDRWAHVARYHRPEQLSRRLWNRLCSVGAPMQSRPLLRNIPTVRRLDSHAASMEFRGSALALDDLAAGRLTLLNLTAELGRPIDWTAESATGAPPLWLFELHSMRWLEGMVRTDPCPAVARSAWNLVVEWIEQFPSSFRGAFRSGAWHPYCISQRVGAWTKLYRFRPPPEHHRLTVHRSLAEQVEYLSRRLERDLGGNHLWENARALWIAGCFFDGESAERWRSLGRRWLGRCLEEQTSPAGEHYERSPMYQSRLAYGLRDAARIGESVDLGFSQLLLDHSKRMLEFLRATSHPDGLPPLFGDTTLDEVAASTNPLGAESGWVGEYFVHTRGSDRLIYDAGDMGPDDLPAHSHADVLGFEMSLGGVRAIVDSGVFAYSGPARSRFRASNAHNVLTVDGEELADCWASFRMGRRGHVVARAQGATTEGRWVSAGHDAFARLGVDRIDRCWFFADGDGPWFSVHTARGRSNRLHQFCERIHWHPDLPWEWDGRVSKASVPSGEYRWEPACDAAVDVVDGAYSPRFYQARSNRVLEIRSARRLAGLSAWTIVRSETPIRPSVAIDGERLSLSWTQAGRRRTTSIPLKLLDGQGGRTA